MQIYTSHPSRILRHSAVITLFFLSSIAAFAAEIEGQENVSKTPSIQPSSISSVESNESDVIKLSAPPPNVSPSVQAVHPELESLKEELEITRLRQQLAEQKMLTQAAEEKLAAEEAARLTAQKFTYTSPPPISTDPLTSLIGGLLKGLATGKRSNERVGHNVSTELTRAEESINNFFQGKGWHHNKRLEKNEKEPLAKAANSSPSSTNATPSSAPFSSIPNPAFQEPEPPSSSSAGVPRTYRTTGENLKANNKHSALSLELPNKDLQDGAYELIVNHRTSSGKNPTVRIYDPQAKTYTNLGPLPTSSSFRDTTFNLSSWANTVRDQHLAESVIPTYLSFVGGKSDIHSSLWWRKNFKRSHFW